MNNFLAVLGELVRSSWDRYSALVRGVRKHWICHESLKDYLYRGQEDINKAVLDTITSGPNRKHMYAQSVEKLEKISWNNKSWSTRWSDIAKQIFAVHIAYNLPTY